MWKGNLDGTILIVQSEHSKDDIEQDTPFSGPPGWCLKVWLEQANIPLNMVAFTDDLVFAGNMPNVKIVVPTDEASKERFLPGMPKIGEIRGSIYNKVLDGCGYFVCPTLHPKEVVGYLNRYGKFIIGNGILEHRCQADWKKIASVLYSGYKKPVRKHNIHPTLDDITTFRGNLKNTDVLSVDIETWGNSLKCVGFAKNETESLVVPTEAHYWHDELPWVMEEIKDICEHECEKIFQNGLFDTWWLHQYDISTKGFVWDTLCMHHALYPRDNHGLGYLASIYTNEPYWKHYAKEADDIVKLAKQGMDGLYMYNGLDATVTHEVYQRLKEELEANNYLEFYHNHYSSLFEPLLSCMLTGISTDKEEMLRLQVSLQQSAREDRDKASQLVNKPLYTFDKTKCERDMLHSYWQCGNLDMPYLENEKHKRETIERKWNELQNKSISDDVLRQVIEGMGLPKSAIGATDTGKLKVDNISLRKIQKYYEERKTTDEKGETVRELVDIVLSHRRSKKLASFIKPEKIDGDNRYRCTYKLQTTTGRLSSSKNPKGTGSNLQNIDRELRHTFIAYPGRILLEIDLSRAENRVVCALTGNDEMINMARRPTTGLDVYKERTAGIYSVLWKRDVTIDEVNTEMRRLGKEVVLASAYGMRGATFSDRILKTLGITLTPSEAQKMLDADMERHPALLNWQKEVREKVRNDRLLFTSWGRHIRFDNDRISDELYRLAYCYVPQSEIGDLTNQWMLKPAYESIKAHKLKSQLIMQVHDAIIIDAVPEEVWHLMRYVQRCVERPRTYGQVLGRNVELVIPCEFAIGRTWKKEHEFKVLPDKDELESTIKEMLR